jgi:hypothetical protein
MGGRLCTVCLLNLIAVSAAVGCSSRSEPLGGGKAVLNARREDHSFYQGTPVEHPEQLSGVWEAPDGRGGAVGLQFILHTAIPAQTTVLADAQQTWTSLEVGIYQRSGPTVAIGEENWFTDSLQDGALHYQNGRLQIASAHYDLDLTHKAGDIWTGRFHRAAYDAHVILRRPEVTHRTAEDWYLGTWMQGRLTFQSCLHVGRGANGALVSWKDSLSELGCVRYGPNVAHATSANESYGELVKAHAQANGDLVLEFGAYSGWCCPSIIEVARGPAGVMQPVLPVLPQQVARRALWRRVAGQSCVAVAGK